MTHPIRTTSLEKVLSPRAATENTKSFSILNYNKGKSSRLGEPLSKQDESPKRLFPPQPTSSEKRGGLIPLNKVMNKSHSTTMLRRAGTMALPKTHTLQDELQDTNTTLDKSISKTYTVSDLKLVARSSSKNRDTKIDFFRKGNVEVEDVKQLDNWQGEMRKRKILNPDDQYKDMLFSKTIGPKETHQMAFPKINTQLINRIFNEAEEEDETKKKRGDMKNEIKALAENRNLEESLKSLEVRMFENKEDLGNTLVIRKIKQYLKTANPEAMNSEALNNQAELIAREAFNSFKSMKGVYAKNNITNCVKLVTENKQLEKHHQGLFDTDMDREKVGDRHSDTEILINYKDIETELRKDLERSTETINALMWKRSHLNGEAKKYEARIKHCEEKLAEIAARELELNSVQPMSILRKPKETKHDHLNSLKDELKHHRIDIQQKMEIIKGKLEAKRNEILGLDQELKEIKEEKSRYKLQLKDLYLNLLKDESYILKAPVSSYTWIIQALWNLSKKIEEEHFPKYLDKDAIHYTMECARIQDTLLKYCNEHNLLNSIPETDSFKYGNTKDMASLIKNAVSPTKATSIPAYSEEKTYNTILSDFQNRMKKMKRENLRIKEHSNHSSSGFRSTKAATKIRYITPSEANDIQSFHQSALFNDSKMFQTATTATENNRGLKIDLPIDIDESEEQQMVKHILNELEQMKVNEKEKMIRKNATRDFDVHQKENLLKVYIFLFGKQEGKEAFQSFFKQQKLYHHRYINFEAPSSPLVRLNASVNSPLRARTRLVSDQKTDTSISSPSSIKEKSKEKFEIIPRPMNSTESPQSTKTTSSHLKGVTWANK